jgi:SAM-dependent methyltransferase
MEAFGFEWNEFSDYTHDNFLDWVTPLQPEFFSGKFGLDGGCGAGRHAMKAHEYGADLVAMDLSPAVDATYAKARTTTGVYVVQGDIFNPPLQPATFEFIYSIGVIHHTPDPPRAFQSIAKLLQPGGTIACLVYASGRPVALGVLSAIRKVTTRVPLPVAKGLSWLAAAIDTVFPITAYRVARKLGAKPAMLEKSFPEHVRIYADQSFATNYTDWLDRLSYPYVHYYNRDEMQEWLDRAGLEDTIVSYVGVHGVTGVGTCPAQNDARATA